MVYITVPYRHESTAVRKHCNHWRYNNDTRLLTSCTGGVTAPDTGTTLYQSVGLETVPVPHSPI